MHPLRPARSHRHSTVAGSTGAGSTGRISRGTAAAAIVAVNLAVMLGFATAATAAVSITNRDETDHKITLIEGEAKKDHVLKPSQVLDGVCPKGCVLRLNDNDDDEYQLEANDIVSIEDGALYYDTPDTPAEPPPGTKPDEKKKP